MNSIMKTTNHSYGIAAILTAILLSLSLDVWGTDYVFSYDGNYLGVNNSGQITNYTTMNENCIWHCSSNTSTNPTAASLSTTSTFLYATVNGTKYWLVGSTTNGTALTATKTAPGDARWRNDNNHLYYQDNKDSYYVYYRGNSWRTSNQAGKNNNEAYSSKNTDYRSTTQIVFRADVNVNISTGLAGSEGGKVAISTSSEAGTYGATASLSQYSTGSSGSKTFYIFAQPATGYEFVGWTTSSSGTTAGSITSPVTKATSSTASAITATTYYAIFRKLETKATVNVGISNKSGTQDGTVRVSESDDAAGDLTTLTQTENSGSQVDKTFYLWASPNTTATENHYVFAGWTETADGETFALGTDQPVAAIVKTGDNVVKNYYAVFKQLKHFQFEAIATPTLNGVESTTAGTATATLDKTDVWATSLSHTSEKATATFSATANPGYAFIGWTATAGKTTPDIDGNGNQLRANPYPVEMTNTAGGMLSMKLYAIFSSTNDPTAVTVSPASATIDKGQTQQISLTFTPETCYKRYTFESSNTEVATVDGNGLVRGVKQGTANITVTVYRYAGTVFQTYTVAVTVMDKLPAPVITITQNISDPTKATATIVKGTGTPDEAVIRYTTDGTDPTASSSEYSTELTLNNNQTIKAIVTCDGWYSSDIVSKTFIMRKTATPVITITKSGNDNVVSFSCADDGEGGITYYYTTDGTDPTTSSTQWNGTAFTPTAAECTIKVIATHTGWLNSDVASKYYTRGSGTLGGIVYLNDLEDHNWAYYKGEETTIGNTTQTYKDKYRYRIYSPDPRNVKITYKGVNLSGELTSDVAVSPTESENQFVYFKTVEKYMIGFFTDANGNGLPDETVNDNEQYAYTVISNPFSKRPKSGSDYYGFAGWKIVSGGNYIGRGATRTAASNGDVLDLDEIIHFINFDEGYTPNCTSAEIVLEATWTKATVKTGTTAQTFTGGTYETNFFVANGDIAAITQSSPCTIIGMYPDGTSNNSTSRTITGLTVGTGAGTVKVEYIRHGDGTFNANGQNLIMGRGITSSDGDAQGSVYCRNTQDLDAENTVKVESGYYDRISNIGNQSSTAETKVNCYMILGCDYDRARANYYVNSSEINSNAYNIKLRSSRIQGTAGSNPNQHRANGQLYIRSLIKSGVFQSSLTDEYYFHSYQHRGQRYIEMEGGYLKGNIKGGSENTEDQTGYRAMSIRIRNGRIDSQIGCGSTSNHCSGERVVMITGGRFGGWIAPGSNCLSSGSGDGITDAESYVYFGGTAEINSRQFGSSGTDFMNQSTGGVIYGAGLGVGSASDKGQMRDGSNIVFADNAYCERGIYGGGALGQTHATANIFILGGRVGTGTGQIIDQSSSTTLDVTAGVYGGACDVGGENSFIYMSGGIVECGIYGGSNITGTMTGNTGMRIVGGQIGKDAVHANVHGGGYGQSTVVSGDVDVNIGTKTGTSDFTYTTDGTAEIYGDVYGGSALGTVNTNASNHTNVTLNGGTVYGSVYGGGLGSSTVAANVKGAVAVKVYGGSVKKTSVLGSGGVYGCNNLNGTPQSTVTVDIYGTDPAPAIDQYALYAVYGGGNQSHYNGKPIVTVHNCDNSIQYVYGGGNASDVTGTDVTIWGGDVIGNVFGGGNGSSEGWPEGQTNPGANVTTNGTNVKINGGTILAVYGGSNTLGTITGGTQIVVNAQKESGATEACPVRVDNIFGAGNQAPYTGNTDVQIVNTGADGSVGNVFGGGNLAVMTGNSNVKIGAIGDYTIKITGDVFGGGNQANTVGDTNVTVENCATTVLNDVYGGANLADVSNSNVTVYGGEVNNVFGGGKGSETGSSNMTNATTNIYGGKFGGIFGAGNIQGDITGVAFLRVDQQTSEEHACCNFQGAKEIYGAGNQATISGSIDFGIGCIPGKIEELYGGAKNADLGSATNPCNVELSITSGEFGKVFGGNNLGGTIYGTVKVNVKHTGCHVIKIDELYGGGNLADYSAPAGKTDYPEINLLTCGQGTVDWKNDGLHCMKVGTIYGGGKGKSGEDKGKVTGNPHVNVYAGEVGTIYGGGNAANVVGDTYVTIIDEHNKTDDNDNQDIYVTGNVYGGGNQAAITGNTHVQIGPKKDK